MSITAVGEDTVRLGEQQAFDFRRRDRRAVRSKHVPLSVALCRLSDDGHYVWRHPKFVNCAVVVDKRVDERGAKRRRRHTRWWGRVCSRRGRGRMPRSWSSRRSLRSISPIIYVASHRWQ